MSEKYEATYRGMLLRDWFAGMALTGVARTANRIAELDKKRMTMGEIAVIAYQVADAMLKERDKVKITEGE